MTKSLDLIVLQNTVLAWLIALGVSVVSFAVVYLILRVVRGRVAAFATRSVTIWDDVLVHALERTRTSFLIVASLYAGSTPLVMPQRVDRVVSIFVVVAILVQTGIWLSAGLSVWLRGYTERQLAHNRGAATTVSAIGFATKFALWVLLLLVALDTAGINVTAMVAGLGIGGIAVALAAQNILGDVFGALSIVLDKPFVLGDFIRVGDLLGTVDRIGMRTTRLRSLWGEGLVFSNSDLLKSRIQNYGTMRERRVLFEIGVTYATPREQLVRIPVMIRDAIAAHGNLRFDRSHFMRYGSASLDFETVYFVLSPDYNKYMDLQQAVLLTIHERFEEAGIDFAFPTQTLFLTRSPARPSA